MTAKFIHNTDGAFEHAVPAAARRIAWNGLSFCVPSNWELASYRLPGRGVSRIELEDEYGVRLEAEWVRSTGRFKLDRIMKRYEKAAKPLTLKADERNAITGLPPGWHATRFVFKETGTEGRSQELRVIRHELVTAFCLCPDSSLFCFFIIHFLPGDLEDPVSIVRRLADTFQDHSGAEFTPWVLFDISFRTPRDFSLQRAQFDIGLKMLVITWRRRRFFLWYFSCADVFLKDGRTPAEWAAGYLNGFGGLRGPVFLPDGKGGITWRRRRPHLFGHRDEIARMCFGYRIGLQMLDGNMLAVWVYNYRNESDLDWRI